MKIEADRTLGVTEATTKHFEVSRDDQHRRRDLRDPTSSTMMNPNDQLQCSVLESTSLLPTVCSRDGDRKSVDEGTEVGRSNCRATEDREDDSDSTASTSTSDELVSDMQHLRLRVEQRAEPLVSRGVTADETDIRWNTESQSAAQVAWPTSVQTDEAALNDVRCKRKIISRSHTINLQPEPVSVAEAFQPATDCDGWTGRRTQQHQHAAKFRRTGSDPQESDECAGVTFDSSLTSALTSEIRGCFDGDSHLREFDLLFDIDPERHSTEYYPDVVSELLPWLNGDGSAPSLQSNALGGDEWTTLNRGNLLDQLEEIRPPPPENWLTTSCPEIASQRFYGDDGHVAMTAAVVDSVVTSHPDAGTSTASAVHGGSAAMNPPGHHVPPAALPSWSDLSPPVWSSSTLSPPASADNGFVASPTSAADDFAFTAHHHHHHHDLPSDVIFEYVEDKLRELVRYVFICFIDYIYVLI